MFSWLILQGALRRYTKTAMRCAQAQVRLSLSRLSVLMCTPLRVWARLSGGPSVMLIISRLEGYLFESLSSVRVVCSISDEMPTLQAVSFACFAMARRAKSTVSLTTPPACGICGIACDSVGVVEGATLPGSVPSIESVFHASSIRRYHLISGWYRAQVDYARRLARQVLRRPVLSPGTRRSGVSSRAKP